jgi:hypothetical protein
MVENNEDEKLNQLLKKVPPGEAVGIVKDITEMVMRQLKDGGVQRIVNESLDGMRQSLGHTDAVLGAVEDLVQKTGDTNEDVLLKALALYDAAIKARQKGQRLVLVGRDYQFVREIVGFDQEEQRPAQLERVAK